MTKITADRLVEKNIGDKIADELDVVITKINMLEASLESVLKTSQKLIGSFQVNNLDDLKKLETELSKIEKTEIDLEKVRQQKIKTQREIEKNRQLNRRGIINERKEQERLNRVSQRNAKIARDQSDAFKRLQRDARDARDEFKRLAVEFGENSTQAQRARARFEQLDTSVRKINDAARNGRASFSDFNDRLGSIQRILGALGLTFAISQITEFTSALINAGNEIKGIEFAFERLGLRGQNAFERIRRSTRGLISDTEIRRALVDFDNFNISLEQTDVLFEFLSVRAAQTGNSIDSLRDSLVEGLSKESRLRIDNLGISASELNEELSKTPDFVEAVTNIAQREVAEAGAILDEAGNAQQRWNARLENTRDNLARNLIPLFDRLFRVLNFMFSNIGNVTAALASLSAGIASFTLVANASSIATRGLATATTLYQRASTLATTATRALSVAVSSSPIGAFVAVVTAAASAFFLLSENTDKATEAQEKNNDEVERGQRLRGDVETIEDRIKTINDLNDNQLKRLISDIETEIKANEDKQERILALNQTISDEITADEDQRNQILIELREDLANETDAIIRKNISDRIQAIQDGADQIQLSEEGITLTQIQENQKRLRDALLSVRRRLQITDLEFDARSEKIRESIEIIDDFDNTVDDLSSIDGSDFLDEEDIEETSQRVLDGLVRDFLATTEGRIELLKAQREADIITEREFQEALAAINQEADQERKERIDDIKEGIRSVTNETEKNLREQNAAINKSLDEEIQTRNDAINTIRNSEDQSLKGQLAFEIAERDRAIAERERQRKREEAQELGIAYIKAFQANLSSDDPTNAALKAFTEVSLAKALSAVISGGFYEGSENVSEANTLFNRKTAKDPFLSWLQPGERVMTDKQNEPLRGISNDTLSNLGKDYVSGDLYKWIPSKVEQDFNRSNKIYSVSNNKEVVYSIDEFRKQSEDNTQAIKRALSEYKTDINFDFISMNKMIETRIQANNKKIIEHIVQKVMKS